MQSELSLDSLERYSRQIVLSDIGYEGQSKLRNAKICVVGVGGLGSLIVMQLTAMGVGYLRIVDRDVIELSNLHRQYLYDTKSIGYPKVEIAAKKLKELNPDVEIDPLPLSVSTENIDDILDGVDFVVDGLDRISSRYVINRACIRQKKPYIFAAAIEAFGNISTIIPGQTPCLECFYSELRDEELPSCSIAGVHPSVLGVLSSLEVSEAVRLAIGKKPLLAGKLLYCDLRSMSFDAVKIARADNCPACGKSPSDLPFEERLVEEICGRRGKRTFIVAPKRDLNLDMRKLYELLKNEFKIKAKAELGLTCEAGGYTLSILKSGIMIAEGPESEDEVLEIYRRILADMGVRSLPPLI